jgi:DNA repair exonuclease SbcCD ATPase subunit
MKFHKLDVQNFLTLKSASIGLDDRGLNLIQGINDDDSSASSNGAGKSSLVDAICWCLFGSTARDVKGDAVVNRGAKKDCRVAMVLSNGASFYRVVRHRKHATFKNSLILETAGTLEGEVSTDLSRGTDAETQKVLEKILGCSQEVFMAAVYSGQEVMPDLPRMKDRELKTLIEEAAGLQRIERAYELARERNLEAKSAANRALDKIGTVKASLIREQEALDKARADASEWTEGREKVTKDLEEAVKASLAVAGVAKTNCDRLEPHKDEAIEQIKEIDVRLSSHKVLEADATIADRAVRAAEMAVDAGALKRLAEEVKKYTAKIANAAEEIKKPCTECGTVLEAMSLADFLAHTNSHLAATKAKLDAAKAKATLQIKEIAILREAAVQAHEAIPDVAELAVIRAGLQEKVNEWNSLDDVLRRAKKDWVAADERLMMVRAEKNPLDATVKRLEESVVSVTALKDKTELELAASNRTAETMAAVVKVFGPAGVRAQILDTVTPFLNERTGDYLSALSDGEIQATWTTLTKSAAGELKEKFSLDVVHAKGGDSFPALSGGEKRKVRIATALALQDLVASRATNPIDLFVGDEIDDALDPAGLERLMTILERRARERGTVLIISHSDLRDWVDNVTVVRKTELWSSTVEGSLCS